MTTKGRFLALVLVPAIIFILCIVPSFVRQGAAAESDEPSRVTLDGAPGPTDGTTGDTPDAVHDLGSEASAPVSFSFSGGATQKIPIEVPPGRAGIAPNLALTYNSYQKNGWVGVGWDLDMGSIQRNTKKGLSYAATSTDFLASINGSTSELVPRGEEWGDGCYGSKIEGAFFRFYRNATTEGWEVTAKNGTVYYYGTTSNSRQAKDSNATFNSTFKWLLDKVKDLNGNTMTVTYDSSAEDGTPYLSRIDYTGHEGTGLQAANSVLFTTETRTDAPGYYNSFSPVQISKRLKTITAKVGNDVAVKYVLNYETSASSARSRLISLTRYGADQTSTLPVQRFTYQGGPGNFGADTTSLQRDYLSDSNYNRQFAVGDVNGDGRQDIVYIDTINRVHVILGTSSGFGTDTVWCTLPHPGFIQLADMNGDGRADLVCAVYGNYGYDHNYAFYVSISTGASFGTQTDWGVYYHLGSGESFRLGDVNGDGKADWVYVNAIGSGYLLLSTGTTLAWPIVQFDAYYSISCTWVWQYYCTIPKFQLIDMNGDGRADLVFYYTYGQYMYGINPSSHIYVKLSEGASFQAKQDWGGRTVSEAYPTSTDAYDTALRIVDMNGDGLPDVVYEDANKQYHVLLNTGTSLGTDTVWGTRSQDLYTDSTYTNPRSVYADVNGDGLPDAVYEAQDGSFRVLLNAGGYALSSDTVWGTRSGSHFEHNPAIRLADIDGDGLNEIVYEDAANFIHILDQTAVIPDLLSTFQNGTGGSYTLSYAPSTAYDNTSDSRAEGDVNIDLPYVVQTLSSITVATDDGYGAVQSSTTTYTYAGGGHNVAEREFRGFAIAEQTAQSGLTVQTKYYQDDVKKGLPYFSQTYAGSKLFKVSVQTYTTTQPFSGISWPQLTQIDESIHEGGTSSRHTQTVIAYDNYGNVTHKYFSGQAVQTVDKRYDHTEYYYDTQNWILGLPHLSYTTETSNPGSIKLANVEYFYTPGTTRLESEVHGSGKGLVYPIVSYDYDAYGNVTQVTDPVGNVTATTYDDTKTYPASVTKAYGTAIALTTYASYDARFGKLLSQTDPNGRTSGNHYDTFGRLDYSWSPADSATIPTKKVAYGSFATPANRVVTTYQLKEHGQNSYVMSEKKFDGLGRVIGTRTTGPGGNIVVSKVEYDDLGRVSNQYLPFFSGSSAIGYTSFDYDELGRVVATHRPDGTSTSVVYGLYGIVSTDANGHKRDEIRDANGRVTIVLENNEDGTAVYATTSYTYDPLGNLRTVTDANGNVTTIDYDSLSRKTSMIDPVMGNWSYVYYPNGNLHLQTDARGQTIEFEYDALNRPTIKRKYQDATLVTYHYDKDSSGTLDTNRKGRLTYVDDDSGRTEFTYNIPGEVISTTKTIDTVSYTTGATYNAMGQLKSVTYPGAGGETVSYAYDAGGFLTQVSSPLTTYAVFSNNYTVLGQPGTLTYGDGAQTTHEYSPLTNRLHTLTTTKGSLIQDLRYDYDNIGNILTITDDLQRPGVNYSQGFTYDHLNRLKTAGFISQLEGQIVYTYGYDKIGNITSVTNSGGPNPYPNLARRYPRTIHYNVDNLPYEILTNQVVLASFVYDYAGKRVSKTTGATTTLYIGDIYESTGGVSTNHIFAGSRRIASKTTGGAVFYYHADHLGSLNAATSNGTNGPQETVAYNPFGEVRLDTGNVNLDYKFTGKEYDPEAGGGAGATDGLYYYGARYYDPVVGRFISPDSIVPNPGNPQSLNRYAYCLNNPINVIDPTGHFSLGSFFSSLAGGIIGAFTFAFTGDPVLSGVAAGGFSGLMSGNLQNMFTGALMGGVSGGLGMVVQANFGTAGTLAMLGIGAGSAVATGGWESLAYMGAGVVGGAIGDYAAGYAARYSANESAEFSKAMRASSGGYDADALVTKIDEYPVNPNGPYTSKDEAAMAAAQAVRAKSASDLRYEWGCWIKVAEPDLKAFYGEYDCYDYTLIRSDYLVDRVSPGLKPYGAVADFHSHVRLYPYKFNIFSPDDKDWNRYFGVSGYLLTPDRGLLRYNPPT